MTKSTPITYFVLILLVVFRVYNSCTKNNCNNSKVSNSGNSVVDLHDNYDKRIQEYLPSPHAELLLGMTIGADYLSRLDEFNDMLKESGTIHVAVVSGFNINLVFNFLIRMLGSKYKLKNFLVATLVTLSYAFISGFEPPVVRSWIMGSTLSLGKLYGRLVSPFYVLVFTAILMILFDPIYLFSLSFQLSFLATLGLILYSDPIESLVAKLTKSSSILLQDLTASLAAQLLVWPLISYKFGTISLISPVSNALLLWTIPISTMLGFCLLLSLLFSNVLSSIFSFSSFIFIDIFAKGVVFFSNFRFSSINYNLSLGFLIFYYSIILLMPMFTTEKSTK